MTETATERILPQRYLAEGETGWHDIAARLATAIFPDEHEKQDRLYTLIAERKFLPNSPAIANLGRGGFTHACLVRVISDSYTGESSIPDSVAWAMRAHKTGAGTGFGLSRIRARGSSVRGTGGVASGPLSFLKVFDMATHVTKQGGFRRGANMAILDWRHPDIREFIDAKARGRDCLMDQCEDTGHYHNFNFSVGVDRDFFSNQDLLEQVVSRAWECGDPGLWFADTTNYTNPTPWIADYEATNPCGETPLLSNESCVLGSVALTQYLWLDTGRQEFYFDHARLRKDIPLMIEALDRMIDVAVYPSKDIEDATKLTRKVGLGVMGLADVLVSQRMMYDTQQARTYAAWIQQCVNERAEAASFALGQDLGQAPCFYDHEDAPRAGRRNAIVTTQAPTGTISMIAGVSSGIEPVFAVTAESHRYLNPEDPGSVHVETIEHPFYSWLREHDLSHFNNYWREASNIDFRDHIRMQAHVQRHVENAVSKTINMSNGATVEDVREAYKLAYDLGCKGITIYREDSKGESPWQRVKETCPECGNESAYRSEGCLNCPNCGSKCDI